jgi:prefoldin subunit 5
MKDEKSLSEKRHDLRNLARIGTEKCPYYLEEDVKEAVRRLKEEVDNHKKSHIHIVDECDCCERNVENLFDILDKIDKIFGDKLSR